MKILPVQKFKKVSYNFVIMFNSHVFEDFNYYKSIFWQSFKGQLISKCPYENSVSSKIPTKIWISALKFLVASWGLPGDLVSNIINKEAYRKPKKLPGSSQEATKNFRTEIQKYFVGFLVETMASKRHFEIN